MERPAGGGGRAGGGNARCKGPVGLARRALADGGSLLLAPRLAPPLGASFWRPLLAPPFGASFWRPTALVLEYRRRGGRRALRAGVRRRRGVNHIHVGSLCGSASVSHPVRLGELSTAEDGAAELPLCRMPCSLLDAAALGWEHLALQASAAVCRLLRACVLASEESGSHVWNRLL